MTRSRPIRTVAVTLTVETALTAAQLRKLVGIVVELVDGTHTIPRGKARGGVVVPPLGLIRGVSVDVVPPPAD